MYVMSCVYIVPNSVGPTHTITKGSYLFKWVGSRSFCSLTPCVLIFLFEKTRKRKREAVITNSELVP